MLRRLYRAVIGKFCRKTFLFWQRLGIHITRCHFYEPIPNTRKLDQSLWENHSELVGIDINERMQLDNLSRFKTAFKKEYDQFAREKTDIPYDYYVNNGLFESVDGEILYCMIRHFKPKKIIEIGSGYSSYLIAKTVLHNSKEYDNYSCDFTTIDPYPNEILQKGFPGLSRLVAKPVQKIPLSEFEKLQENDMLLIDSSHVLKISSDVQYMFLEVLPRLNEGVIIAFHDIFLPAEYPKVWILREHFFWNEQYFLQAFLAFNDSFRVLWGGSYMHLKHSEKLKAAFPSYNQEQNWPGSFWISKMK